MRMRCSCKCHLPARPRRLHARPRRILCSSASNAAAMDSTPAPEAGPGASSSATAAAISTASSNPLLLRLQRCCHGLHAGTRGGPRRLFRQDLAGGVAVMTLEECIQEDELRRLLDNKPVLICYDGFEPPDACTSLRRFKGLYPFSDDQGAKEQATDDEEDNWELPAGELPSYSYR